MQFRRDPDGVSGDRGDLQDLATTSGYITLCVCATGGRVPAPLLQSDVVSHRNTQTRDSRKTPGQFVCGGTQRDSRAVVRIAVAGSADHEDGSAGGRVVDEGAARTVHRHIRDVDG